MGFERGRERFLSGEGRDLGIGLGIWKGDLGQGS